ncbi:hypothetical protein L9F63_019802 [Diploptera punctata]|uniref:SAM domain-containing protein n=1 Tax=Diploptera punctata TaxID=6984 RepID=A0AAD7ZTJ6_DIPPU|nr:hypothetical protein L9F63_019802 [Diploptera punctata]
MAFCPDHDYVLRMSWTPDCAENQPTLADFDINDSSHIDLCTAASIGDHEVILSAVNSNDRKTLWKKNANGWTPFLYACYQDQNKIIKLLLSFEEHRFDCNNNGITPMMYAALNGNCELLALLYEGRLINMTDVKGWTPLFYAISRRKNEAVKFLLQCGANVDTIASDNGYSALMVAAAGGKPSIVEMLLNAGANPHLVAWDGDTALSIAHRNGFFEVVRLLSPFSRHCEYPLIDLYCLLYSKGLEEHYKHFQARDIDMRTFFTLTEDDLKEIGIRIVGPRKKMLQIISQWQEVHQNHMCHAKLCNLCYGLYL